MPLLTRSRFCQLAAEPAANTDSTAMAKIEILNLNLILFRYRNQEPKVEGTD
jgi:hypothetical protein